jgi:predicted metal-dependent hydrolase
MLHRLLNPRAPSLPDSLNVIAEGKTISISLRVMPNAKRMILKVKASNGQAVLSVPQRVPLKRVQSFADSHAVWLSQKIRELPTSTFIAHGVTLPIAGEPHVIRSLAQPRGLVRTRTEEGTHYLDVPGDPAYLPRKVKDYLKKQARLHIDASVARYTSVLGVTVGRIGIKDTTSRWGSCSARGDLSFSFRLVLAPPFVLDYVVAHELAHRREMNHSPRFWALLEQIAPHTGDAEQWLKTRGRTLHRFTFTPPD